MATEDDPLAAGERSPPAAVRGKQSSSGVRSCLRGRATAAGDLVENGGKPDAGLRQGALHAELFEEWVVDAKGEDGLVSGAATELGVDGSGFTARLLGPRRRG